MNTKIVGAIIGVAAVFLIVVGILASKPSGPQVDLTEFAQCITASKATFYGAFWCPHCAAQKALFGDSVKYLPYTECSTPDGNSQNQTCNDAKIQSYPTWQFADGTRVIGEQSLETLAAKTSCPLPAALQAATSTDSGASSAATTTAQ